MPDASHQRNVNKLTFTKSLPQIYREPLPQSDMDALNEDEREQKIRRLMDHSSAMAIKLLEDHDVTHYYELG